MANADSIALRGGWLTPGEEDLTDESLLLLALKDEQEPGI